jgi:hypothetical protein
MTEAQNTESQELRLDVGRSAHKRPLISAKFVLKQGLRIGAIGCLVATALGAAYACDEPHLHQKTRSAAFLHDCGGQTPASVASINSECPNVQRGLVGSGSTVIFLKGVNRTLSGQKGLWYEVCVVHNQSTQSASTNAQEGAIGWLRANKF